MLGIRTGQDPVFWLDFFVPDLFTCVADPDPGSGMNIPDHISESFETIFLVKIQIFWLRYLNSLMRMRIRSRDPGIFFNGVIDFYFHSFK